MELFEGKCLQYNLDHFKIDLIHRLHILSDVANAIAFCHNNEIIHADLKPQNILVALKSRANVELHHKRRYVCKLLDFGCSTRLYLKHDNIGVGNL